MADLQFIVGYDSVKAANKELIKIGTNAQKSASVFERAFKKAESQSSRALRQVKNEMNVRQRLAKQRNAEASAASKVAAVAVAEETRLKNKYDQGYRAMVIYTKELNDLSMARKKDIITTDQQAKEVAALNAQMAAGTGAFANAGKAMTQSKNKMNGSNMAVQQLGYQMGDFAVQVQGGTSAFVAFSQQGAQLAGMLPMVAGPLGLTMGAAVGLSAALGIGIPIFSAVGRMFFEMGDSAKDAKDKIRSITDVMKDLKTATKEASMELRVLQGAFRDSLEVESADKVLALRTRILDIDSKILSIKSKLSSVTSRESADQSRSGPSSLNLGNLREGLVLQKKQAETQIEFLLNARNLSEETEALRVVELARLENWAEILDAQLESQDSFDKQLYAQSQALALLELENQYTKDSAQYRAELVAQEVDRLQTLVRQKKITEAQAVDALRLFEANQSVTTELADSAKQGQNLADALNRAASAMASLSGFSVGIEKSLAVAVAQTKALVAGANAANSGRIAGMRFDAQAKYNATKSAGVSGPASVEAESIFNKSMAGISDIESQLNIQAGIKADNSASSGGGSSSNPVEKLRQQIELNSKLVGLSKEEATVLTQVNAIQNSLGKDRGKYSRETIVGLVEQNEAYKEQQRVVEEAKAQQDSLATSMASSFGDAFKSIVDGTMSVKDAFKSMASSIIKQLFEIFVVKKITGFIEAAIGGFSGGGVTTQANGGVWTGGSQVQAYANGGVVNGPTNFPMSGNKMGLMGEAGPEAIMPLKRGANGKLGVQAEGGSKGGDVINISQTFSFSANGDDSVKKIIQQQMPRITEATKSAVVDAKRRGGSYGRSFG